MIPTIRVLMAMGSLQRLLPFWLIGMATLITWFSPVLILAVIYGAVVQFVVEYIMHRFLYHRAPPTEQSVFNELYRSHIGHHEFPNKPEFFTGGDNWYAVKFGLISVGLHFVVLWPFVGAGWAILLPVVAIFVGSISAPARAQGLVRRARHALPPRAPFSRPPRDVSRQLWHGLDRQAIRHAARPRGRTRTL